MSINRVSISGNLTRDPELRTTPSGTAVLNFGVAVNDRRKNQHTGEWEDYPNFVDCVMFGTRAEAVSRFLQKGTKVAIDGALRYSAWQATDGSKRSKLEVVVDEVEFMSPRQQGGGYERTDAGYAQQPYAQQATAYAQPRASYAPKPQQQDQPQVYDEEIPF